MEHARNAGFDSRTRERDHDGRHVPIRHKMEEKVEITFIASGRHGHSSPSEAVPRRALSLQLHPATPFTDEFENGRPPDQTAGAETAVTLLS